MTYATNDLGLIAETSLQIENKSYRTNVCTGISCSNKNVLHNEVNMLNISSNGVRTVQNSEEKVKSD